SLHDALPIFAIPKVEGVVSAATQKCYFCTRGAVLIEHGCRVDDVVDCVVFPPFPLLLPNRAPQSLLPHEGTCPPAKEQGTYNSNTDREPKPFSTKECIIRS